MRIHHLLLGAALALATSAPAGAQRGTRAGPLHYDTATVQTVAGTVAAVMAPAPQARRAASVEVLLLTGADSLVVHLGPAWHLQQNGLTIAKGDRVEVTGSKTTVAGRPALVAREISKDGKMLKLRDQRGTPLWTPRSPGR